MSSAEHSDGSGGEPTAYRFSETEIRLLAPMIRNCVQVKGRSELEQFYFFLEKYLYTNLTIEEAEKYFNEA